ncbi:MAG: hypothetical protein KKC19_01235 [Nanoarchaeota archaeon]|nr:hypothetical protein [Nanoarchaeota archaeon]
MIGVNFIIGLAVLGLCFPLGIYLAKITREELDSGQRWFRLIVTLSFIGAILGLVLGNDVLLFTFLSMVIITSRSLKRKK